MARPKKQSKAYSQEDGNLEVVKTDEKQTKSGLSLSDDGIKMGKETNLYIGNLNVYSGWEKRHNRHYKNSKFHLIADLVLALVIALMIITTLKLVFWNPKPEVTLDSSINTSQVNSGELQTFTLKYKSSSRLENNSLSVNLPKNFVLVSTVPTENFSKQNNTFKLPELMPGANGEVKVTGYTIGKINSQQAIAFTFNCDTCSKNGTLNSLIYTIEDSTLNLDAWTPEEFYLNTNSNINLTIKNNSANTWDRLVIKLPTNWLMTGNDNIIDNQLLISNLQPNESRELSLDITPTSIDSAALSLDYFLIVNGQELKQGTWQKKIGIKEPQLKVTLNSNSKYIDAKNIVYFTLSYDNLEDTEIKDLSFRVIASNNFKIKNLILNQSSQSFSIIDNVIVVHQAIASQDQGQINFSAELENINPKINQSLQPGIEANYSLDNKTINYSLNTTNIKVLSNLQTEAVGRYYSPQGDQLGVGPLPPIAGIPTTYWIFFNSSNFGNELSQMVLSAELGDNVVWADKKSVINGDLRYGAGSNKVIWELKKVVANSSSNTARFAVILDTNENQIGTIPTLLKNIQVSAHDDFVNTDINFKLPDITTALSSDNLASNRAEVQP